MNARFFAFASTVAFLLLVACINPVHSDAVDALGGEVNGVGPGPRHRPGQPCLTCHGGDGPGPDFAIGGTVYAVRNGSQGLGNVSVILTAADGSTKTLVSNDVGNFYLEASRWTPTFPLFVRLEAGGVTKEMNTRMGGSGSCATCHYGADNEPDHSPPVYMREP